MGSKHDETRFDAGEAAARSDGSMTRADLLDALSGLLPAQLDALLFKLGAPAEFLSGASAAPATRIVEVLRWAEQQGRLGEVEQLYRAMVPRAAAARVAIEPPAASVEIGRLPVPGKYLFGRDKELARLDAAWNDEGTRVVSIVAMGGAGKSALVDRWLKQRMQKDKWRGAERVYGWSFYSQGSSDGASGDAFIAEALRWFGHIGEVPVSAWDRGELLARLVKQHKTLLVLDGLEPLQAPEADGGKIRDHGVAALVRELAADGRGLCVISTRFAISDLASGEEGPAPRIDLDELSPEDGAKLLEVLGAKGPPKELEDAAREMKGHALALTLLGSFVHRAYKGDIRRRKEIKSLTGDAKQRGAHAKRVMEAYARWFGDGPEIAVLQLLGLFDRPADKGCIQALRAEPAIPGLTDKLVGMSEVDWNETLSSLRDAHMLTEVSEGEPGSIDAHPLVREHFGARLREEALEAWKAGHGRLFEHLQKVAPELPEDTVAMAPLYSAVVHGCHAERRQEALDDVLLKRVYRSEEFFNTRKLGAFGAQLGMTAAFFDPPWTRLAPGLTAPWEAFVLSEAGFVLRALGRLDEAAEPIRLGLEKSIAQEDWKNAAINANNLSELHLARGAVGDAVATGRQSVELADRSGDAFLRMARRTTLADALHQAGSLDGARALFEQAEALQVEHQPEYPRLYALQGFRYCDLLLGQGLIENLLDRARQTLAWVTAARKDILSSALDHLSLGRAHLLLALRDRTGDLAPARAELDQAVAGLRQSGRQDILPLGLLARAELHLAADKNLPAAERDLAEALSIATRGGMRLFEADAHLIFTRLHLARGNREAALASLALAKPLIEQTGYHRRAPDLAELTASLAAR
jgi:tetratricopeptide (TPR) repeat protein